MAITALLMAIFAGSYGFGHIYWRNPSWKTSFFVQCQKQNFYEFLRFFMAIVFGVGF